MKWHGTVSEAFIPLSSSDEGFGAGVLFDESPRSPWMRAMKRSAEGSEPPTDARYSSRSVPLTRGCRGSSWRTGRRPAAITAQRRLSYPARAWRCPGHRADVTALRRVEALQQRDDGGLAGTGGVLLAPAALPRLGGERHALEHPLRFATGIGGAAGEPHVAEPRCALCMPWGPFQTGSTGLS